MRDQISDHLSYSSHDAVDSDHAVAVATNDDGWTCGRVVKIIVSDGNETHKIVKKALRLKMTLNFKLSSKRMRCVFITKRFVHLESLRFSSCKPQSRTARQRPCPSRQQLPNINAHHAISAVHHLLSLIPIVLHPLIPCIFSF